MSMRTLVGLILGMVPREILYAEQEERLAERAARREAEQCVALLKEQVAELKPQAEKWERAFCDITDATLASRGVPPPFHPERYAQGRRPPEAVAPQAPPAARGTAADWRHRVALLEEQMQQERIKDMREQARAKGLQEVANGGVDERPANAHPGSEPLDERPNASVRHGGDGAERAE